MEHELDKLLGAGEINSYFYDQLKRNLVYLPLTNIPNYA